MDAIAGFLWQMLKHALFSFVFFWPGWLVVKVLTLGRCPRAIRPARADWLDYEVLSFIGLFTVVGGILLVTHLLT